MLLAGSTRYFVGSFFLLSVSSFFLTRGPHPPSQRKGTTANKRKNQKNSEKKIKTPDSGPQKKSPEPSAKRRLGQKRSIEVRSKGLLVLGAAWVGFCADVCARDSANLRLDPGCRPFSPLARFLCVFFFLSDVSPVLSVCLSHSLTLSTSLASASHSRHKRQAFPPKCPSAVRKRRKFEKKKSKKIRNKTARVRRRSRRKTHTSYWGKKGGPPTGTEALNKGRSQHNILLPPPHSPPPPVHVHDLSLFPSFSSA